MTTGLADPANGHIANRFNLADEACEDALYDMAVIREFCRIDLSCARGAGILR